MIYASENFEHYRNETLHMHNQDKKQINELRKFIISSIILMSQFA